MSSSLLFNIAGGIFLVMPLGHTQMYLNVLVPSLKPAAASEGAYASKVSWNQANGYFITVALLCFKWASSGVPPGIERWIFGVLMTTHAATAAMYVKKGVPGPPLAYLSVSLLMGVAALKGR